MLLRIVIFLGPYVSANRTLYAPQNITSWRRNAGNDGPTERISAFVDNILQPIAQSQKSYLKDTTDFINFIERTTLPESAFLVSLDVTSLYTNIPQEEGINTVCRAFENFYKDNMPIPTHSLRKILMLILKENSFEFNDKNYLQIHGTAMGTKMAVVFVLPHGKHVNQFFFLF